MKAANTRDGVTYQILRPTDFTNFLVQAYLANAKVELVAGPRQVLGPGLRRPERSTAGVLGGLEPVGGGLDDVLAALKSFKR